MKCGLCGTPHTKLFYQQTRGTLQGREFWRCQNCQLIQVPAVHRLSLADEKAIYDYHENDPQDPHYRSFLDRAAVPLQSRLHSGAQGLDFGSGPGPTLSLMLTERGFPCAIYDVFYAPDTKVLNTTYDYITCTEVIEHIAAPADVLEQLLQCLKPGGWLVLMTKRWRDLAQFKGWNYRNDPTHISFFHQHTIDWLACHWSLRIDYLSDDVVIFQTKG